MSAMHKPRVPRHPALSQHDLSRGESAQNRIADKITGFAGSMWFVNLHVIWFAAWIIFRVEAYPYGLLTMIVSLEAIFLSAFVMIGQNRQSAFQQAKADHDFIEQEQELKTNTELTRAVHTLATEIRNHVISDPIA